MPCSIEAEAGGGTGTGEAPPPPGDEGAAAFASDSCLWSCLAYRSNCACMSAGASSGGSATGDPGNDGSADPGKVGIASSGDLAMKDYVGAGTL